MRIFLDGYTDNNFGDDLMMYLAAKSLGDYEIYTENERLLTLDNVRRANKKNGFDCFLKVTGSGFLIHNSKGILYRIRDMHRERKCAQLRAVINCNISPFINKTAEKIIQRQLKNYDFITVRDNFSYDYIKKNIPSLKCEKYPDMVFSLPDSMIPDVQSENALGIAVHNSADCAVLAQTADGFIEETGKKVLLLCFDTGLENDKAAAQKVYNAVKHKGMLETMAYTDIFDMLSNMKRCGVILGIRLHSVILAARMRIPFVPMAYSDKHLHVLEDIGYKDTIYTSDANAETLLKAILTAKPYDIDKSAAASADNHIIKFKEYIKQQV